MTGVPALAPLKQRLAAILRILAERMPADADAITAGIAGVQEAGSGEEALAAWLQCLMGLTGLPAGEWNLETGGSADGSTP